MKKVRLAACAVALSVGGLSPLGLSPAAADTASTAGARAFGLTLDLAGTPVVDADQSEAISVLPPGGDVIEDLANIPVNPVVETGLIRGQATTSFESTIPSLLEEEVQAVPGPYNARAVGQVDDLAVIQDLDPTSDDPNLELALVSADTVRAEAVGVCRAGRAVYSGQSELINAEIDEEPLDLNDPVTDLFDTVNDLLEPLNQIADIERDIVTVTDQGVVVTALRVTVLGAIEDATGGLIPDPAQPEPLVDLVVGRAEVGGLQCPPADRPECSDTQDNDGDGRIDANDPGCINNGVFDPNDDDERDLPRTVDTGPELPRTGGDSSTTLPLAGGFAVLALGALALRRRSQSSS